MATSLPEPARRTRVPRLAAGRARALGLPTRGTTHPQRLRRVDRWLAATQAPLLRAGATPLVVDLGYGASGVTTAELAQRLAAVAPGLRVVGVENDRARVHAALASADPPRLTFTYGGFDCAGLRPVLVRVMNVLRQYDEAAVPSAWAQLRAATAPGGLIVEGTCDELGRRCTWVAVTPAGGPVSLTLAAHLPTLGTPGALAERLPKALIHRNVPGEGVHALLQALDAAWAAAAPASVFGPRQRWLATCAAVRAAGWPVLDTARRWRLGELTVDYAAVAPRTGTGLDTLPG